MYLGYKPKFTGPFQDPDTLVLPTTFQESPRLSGHGSPEGEVPGVPGQQYVDLDTTELWLKIAGNQKIGWRLIGEAIEGLQVFMGSGSPEGVVTATAPAIYYDLTTGATFQKTGVGTNNTGWV